MSGIIAGIDGSAHSSLVLEWALKEGSLRNAHVTVITVDNVPASPWTGNPTILAGETAELERIRKIAEELTQQVASGLGGRRPQSVTVRAVAGYPAKELIDASQDADLVVVGSRGTGGFARLLLGSVSSQVAEHAGCPVVVVPCEK
ncbi:MAG TPA: universal stress protein [Streptosporangiaceae bacterium]|nr:universal stress protein [Streptosporangiaceae bacterium]